MTGEGPRAVFLSYASQDAEAARRLCDALRAAGIEVWFDQSELRGGDAWDQKIRRQIRDCALFLPVVSASTQRRPEGYFRLEWHLAEQRSHLIAHGRPFIVPVAIDATADADALVPDAFFALQWTRLPGGAATPEFAGHVKRLLEGEPMPAAPAGRAGSAAAPAAGARKRRGPLLVWAALALLVAGVAGYWARRPRGGPIAAPAASAPDQPAPSEARQLAERARAIFQKWDSTADDFAAAEGLVKRALELDQNDAEIWAISSMLNRSYATRGFDPSPGRKAAARSQAERALTLDPGSIDGLYALGTWDSYYDPDAPAGQALLEKVLKRDPDYALAAENLAQIYFYKQGRLDESSALLDRAAAQPDCTALARYVQFRHNFGLARFADADRCIRQSIAAGATMNNSVGLAFLLLTWKGDAEGALGALSNLPDAERYEDRTVWVTAFAQLCRRRPDGALETLSRLPADYIQDDWFTGPRSYWEGRAFALAGRADAARLAWEQGLNLVEAKLKDAPEDVRAHLMRGELLALLGRSDEALGEVRASEELRPGSDREWAFDPVRICAELGRADEALPRLRKLVGAGGTDVRWPLTPALLRIDPMWDRLRSDARFQKLVADADEAEQAAAPPRDWPKDPELKRAVGILEDIDSGEEDYALAEDLVKGVLAARPTDPEAVTVMARVQTMYLIRGFDRSQERSVQAKRYTERALELAPDEPEAMAVNGEYLGYATERFQDAENWLRKAIAAEPQNPVYRRFLLEALLSDPAGKPEAAIALAGRNAALFPRDVLTQYDAARALFLEAAPLSDCEAALDRTLALAPSFPNALAYKAWTALLARRDLGEMKSWLDRVPARGQSLERVIFGRFACAFYGRRWQDGLDALESFPGPWMEDLGYVGPPAFLIGTLLECQGKAELARVQFEAALAELQRYKAAHPARVIYMEPWLYTALGRRDEAEASARINLEALQRPYRLMTNTDWIFTPIPMELLLGKRSEALALIREASESPVARQVIRSNLALDWRLAPFRNDPEVLAAVAEPKAGAP